MIAKTNSIFQTHPMLSQNNYMLRVFSKLLLPLLLSLSFSFVIFSHAKETAVRIMPVGDSITAGEHYGFPSMAKREGYRKLLYDQLIAKGFNVDFVGRTEHGKRPEGSEDWFDWESESYPGWKIPDITAKVAEALPLFKPDILLVHIGTNGKDWSTKTDQLKAFLDTIDAYSVKESQSMTVVLAKIINFFENSSPEVTAFNQEIEAILRSLSFEGIHVILIDMENGAGLDYSDRKPDPETQYPGGDMWGRSFPGIELDKYHPNLRGYKKIAVIWYEALTEILEPAS